MQGLPHQLEQVYVCLVPLKSFVKLDRDMIIMVHIRVINMSACVGGDEIWWCGDLWSPPALVNYVHTNNCISIPNLR